MSRTIKSWSYTIYQEEPGAVILEVHEDRNLVSIERKPLLTMGDMLNIAHHGYEGEDSLVGVDAYNRVAQIDSYHGEGGAWSDITLYPAAMRQDYKESIGLPEDLELEQELVLQVEPWMDGEDMEAIWDELRDEKLRNDLHMTRGEADRYDLHDVAVIIEDRKTKNEALKALDKGTVVINITEENWDK